MIRARKGALSSVERWKWVSKMMRESASTTQRALLSEKQEGNKKIYDMNSGGVSFVALGFAC